MIDFVKIKLQNPDVDYLINRSWLTFYRKISQTTGEYESKRVATHHFCKVTIFDSGIVIFSGSIHKMYNSINNISAPNYSQKKNYSGFNGNIFTINEIFEARKHLCELLNCSSSQLIIQNIEFGINAKITTDPQKFIKGLLYQRGKKFEFKFNDYFSQVYHQRYILKIYNKSKQYGMDENIIRIEIKELKAIDFEKTGIITFYDINHRTLEGALDLLQKRFDEVVYYDYTIRKSNLNTSQKRALERYSNPRFWMEEISPNKRDKHKKKLNNFITEHSLNLKHELQKELKQKGVIINREIEKNNRVTINNSNIELILTHFDIRDMMQLKSA